MKNLLLGLAAVMMTACTSKNPDGSIALSNGSIDILNKPTTVVIDSCEYISWGYGMAHKGNCKFCAERRRKELEELVTK